MRIKVEVIYDDKDGLNKHDIERLLEHFAHLIARFTAFKDFRHDYGFHFLNSIGKKINRSFTFRKFSQKELWAANDLMAGIPLGKQKK